MLAIITPIDGRSGRPDNDLPGGGGRPDNDLPGRPERPDNSLPSLPNYPDNGLPNGGTIEVPSHPIHVPPPPHTDNGLPPVIWPGVPVHPGTPTHPITLPPGTVWPPLPPAVGQGKALALVLVPGVGSRWVVLDLSNTPMPK